MLRVLALLCVGLTLISAANIAAAGSPIRLADLGCQQGDVLVFNRVEWTCSQAANSYSAYLFDANKRLIGPALSPTPNGTPAALIPYKTLAGVHRVVIVGASGNRFESPGVKYFSTSDCTGQAYAETSTGVGMRYWYYRTGQPLFDKIDGGREVFGLYVPVTGSIPSGFTISAHIQGDGSCYNEGPRTRTVIPVIRVLSDIYKLYPPPFDIRLPPEI